MIVYSFCNKKGGGGVRDFLQHIIWSHVFARSFNVVCSVCSLYNLVFSPPSLGSQNIWVQGRITEGFLFNSPSNHGGQAYFL